MHIITIFFTGIAVFFSGLFGHSVVPQPAPTTQESVVVASSSIATTEISTSSSVLIDTEIATSSGVSTSTKEVVVVKNEDLNKFITPINDENGIHKKAIKADKASIIKDFRIKEENYPSGVLFPYENKDRIYFLPPGEKDGCGPLAYLDKISLFYYETAFEGCPTNYKWPYYFSVRNSYSDILSVVSLDTGMSTELYTTEKNETLVNGYNADSGESSYSIEILPNGKIKIGIFVPYKDEIKTPSINVTNYIPKKIRDEVISLPTDFK